MSKTIDAQIEKSELLIEGFRKHIENLREWGVEEADLGAMSERLKDHFPQEVWQQDGVLDKRGYTR